MTLVESIREQLAPAQFGAASAAEFAAAVMARIDAYKRTRVACAVRSDPVWTRPRPVCFAGACVALFALLAVALVLARTSRSLSGSEHASVAAAPDGSASVSLRSDQACLGQEPSAETKTAPDCKRAGTGLSGLSLQEESGDVLDRAMAVLEAEVVLPHTDQEIEAWARREYPDVMWLYDLLCKEFGYAESWRELLRGSGTLQRFDWPTAEGQPNCRPSLAAVRAAASIAGYEVALAEDGQFAMPALAWPDAGVGVGRVRVRRLPERRPAGAVQGLSPQPQDYADILADSHELAGGVLAYLAVSSDLFGSEDSRMLALRCKALVGIVWTKGLCPDAGCASACAPDESFEQILSTRRRLLESRP